MSVNDVAMVEERWRRRNYWWGNGGCVRWMLSVVAVTALLPMPTPTRLESRTTGAVKL
jgi:hypothetical protein